MFLGRPSWESTTTMVANASAQWKTCRNTEAPFQLLLLLTLGNGRPGFAQHAQLSTSFELVANQANRARIRLTSRGRPSLSPHSATCRSATRVYCCSVSGQRDMIGCSRCQAGLLACMPQPAQAVVHCGHATQPPCGHASAGIPHRCGTLQPPQPCCEKGCHVLTLPTLGVSPNTLIITSKLLSKMAVTCTRTTTCIMHGMWDTACAWRPHSAEHCCTCLLLLQ